MRDRDVGRVVRNDLRRLGAAGHIGKNGLGDRVDLRDCARDIGAGLKINFQQTDTKHRFGLDVLDTVDGRRIGALADEDHAALHVQRCHAGVVPDHHHHRHVDRREDVDVHQKKRQRAQHQHQQRHHGD